MSQAQSADLKTALRGDGCLLGTWLTTSDPMMAEAVALAGFDFCILDAEHGAVTATTALATQMAADRAGVPLIVRVPQVDAHPIMAALDTGAAGIIAPRIDDLRGAEQAIRLAHYPPRGNRGYGPRRASGYLRQVDDYLARAEASTIVIVQIETRGALDALDDIIALPGLDAILVGRNDLAIELGLPRDPAHPELTAITVDVLARARAAGIGAGLACGAAAAAATAAGRLGATFVAAGIDVEFLARAVDGFVHEVRASWTDPHA